MASVGINYSISNSVGVECFEQYPMLEELDDKTKEIALKLYQDDRNRFLEDGELSVKKLDQCFEAIPENIRDVFLSTCFRMFKHCFLPLELMRHYLDYRRFDKQKYPHVDFPQNLNHFRITKRWKNEAINSFYTVRANPDLPFFQKNLDLSITSILAESYCEKYKINIKASTNETTLQSYLREFIEDSNSQELGIIVGFEWASHVVPVTFIKRNGEVFLLILESSVEREGNIYRIFMSQIIQHNINVLTADDYRQSTDIGCRTEAFSLLKRVLLNLKNDSNFDIERDLNPKRYFMDVPYDNSIWPASFVSVIEVQTFKLPDNWSPGAQIKKALSQTGQLAHIKKIKDENGNVVAIKPETVEEFRARRSVLLTLCSKYEGRCRDARDSIEWSYSDETKKNVLFYLQLKSRKLAVKFFRVLQDKYPQVIQELQAKAQSSQEEPD